MLQHFKQTFNKKKRELNNSKKEKKYLKKSKNKNFLS